MRFLIVVLLSALGLVFAIDAGTNETRGIGDYWDPHAYQEIAQNGLLGNTRLRGPFAFRPAAPLAIGELARLSGWSVQDSFRFCARAASVLLVVACFFLARRFGARPANALWIAVVVLLNLWFVKWALFAVSMVDIYAYPVFLLAFYLLWEGRLWLCAAVSAPGLLFKEFMLVPLGTVTGLWLLAYWAQWRRLVVPLATIAAILLVFFVLPRALIPVIGSTQEIDPAQPRTWARIYLNPLDPRRWFNIVFTYAAVWLPVVMLLTWPRLRALGTRLAPRAALLLLFAFCHLVLVIYGGTNIGVFVSYSLPVEILVLHYLLEDGKPHVLELVLVTVAVVVFNRTFSHVPLPEVSEARYLEYYGGFHNLVTQRSFWRLAELAAFVLAAMALRRLLVAARTPATR